MSLIITISREVGSNGHAIGEMVAKTLGVPLLDKYFISEVAKDMGIAEDKVADSGEYLFHFEKYMSARFYNGMYLGDDQDDMYQIQRKIILEEAAKGPCVIVGRCADAILRSQNIPCLNVFVHASPEYRRDVCVKRYPELSENVDKFMKKKDKGRRSYYHFYTDSEWGVLGNYDLSVDSSRLGLEACAQLIVAAAEAKEKLVPAAETVAETEEKDDE